MAPQLHSRRPCGRTVFAQASLALLLAVSVSAPGAPVQAAGADNVGGATPAHPSILNDSTDNTSATRDAGETGTCGAFPAAPAADNTRSLWYKYTAAGGGWLTADTRGSSYDTVLEVYTSTVGAPTAAQLVSVACNDDINTKSLRQSQVQLAVSAGVTYYLAVRSYGTSAATGTANFSAAFSATQDLYVALTGDDANLGAADAPFRTVQQAVEAASAAGDAVIHILDAGPYVSTTINKTLKLAGANTTLAALTLSNSALIVAGTSGVSAPAVTVNAGSHAQDGVNLAAAGGTVALAAGTYAETLTLSRAVTVQGPASGPRAIIDPASGAAVQVTAGAGSTLAHVDLQGAATGVLVSGGSGLTLSGLNFASTVTAVSASVPVSATGNYWGDPSGPTHAANPGAAGYPVSDNVTFSPWCSNPAPACTPLRGPLAKLV